MNTGENQIAGFQDKSGLEAVLTTNKLFVRSMTRSETFALRAVVGCGIYDDIDTFTKELSNWNNTKSKQTLTLIIAGIAIVLSLTTGMIPVLFLAFILILIAFVFFNSGSKPVLFSYLRIITLGGTRDFKFDKSEAASESIADFISRLEETFTSYKQ
ncbi:MAG: hypothetical protein H6546_03930 [Chitinophagales bacterium]|nr:hypothetical protein [Saprospiraceae bacterium]MCB9019457.1 hypothetical protein [Chitinophagales bacterium]MCB9312603.1 hypothetical protein [Lewinellaceae bacterium]HRW74503.1 hypothetical protein [Saprospiraceae bacterium]